MKKTFILSAGLLIPLSLALSAFASSVCTVAITNSGVAGGLSINNVSGASVNGCGSRVGLPAGDECTIQITGSETATWDAYPFESLTTLGDTGVTATCTTSGATETMTYTAEEDTTKGAEITKACNYTASCGNGTSSGLSIDAAACTGSISYGIVKSDNC